MSVIVKARQGGGLGPLGGCREIKKFKDPVSYLEKNTEVVHCKQQPCNDTCLCKNDSCLQ